MLHLAQLGVIMNNFRGARRTGIGAIIGLITSLTLGATVAAAQPVTAGSLSFNGDPGDFITGGQSYSYSVAAGDSFQVASEDGNHVQVSVRATNGDWWDLNLAAPSGQTLTPGDYQGAIRYPFQAPSQPGLDLSGNGRGCNTVTGSFTVQQAAFGPHGYVQTFDATYEEHCEGGTPALRGDVHITNPPAPAELGIGVTVATTGTASRLTGNATVNGTATCTEPVTITVSGTVTQVAHRVIIRGSFSTSVGCTPNAPVAWSGKAVPTGTTPFQRGKVEVVTNTSAVDPNYGTTVNVDQTTVVTLRTVPQ